MGEDAVRDEARGAVAARGLTPTAVGHLTRDALGRVELDALAPIKGLLKRYFSDGPWAAADDAALADLVGPGSGTWRHPLDADLDVEYGWRDDRFRLAVTPALGATFAGAVVPEATPNPRTIRFAVGPIHDGPSRWYEHAGAVDDPRAAQLFAAFPDVANVLVGPDFVAVGLLHAHAWDELLGPVLRAVEQAFRAGEPEAAAATGAAAPASRSEPKRARDEALDRAWRELGALRGDDPEEAARILAAVSAPDGATRQVAARLLTGVDPAVAHAQWAQLLVDPSRRVRRAMLDAVVDSAREDLRPLLERALRDADAWVRWKAVRGLAELGVAPSREAVGALVEDADVRVRLEVSAALRAG